MSTSQTNQAFVPDDDKSFTPPPINGEKEKQNAYTLDMRDINKPKNDIDNYDPYKHRTVEHPTTNSETLFHLLKGSLGTGILAMPNAFYHSGYVFGLVGTLIIGLICTYCIHLLISAEYELCKRKKIPSLSYPETTKLAFSEGPKPLQIFAPYSGHMVNTFLLIYQLGTCSVYIVFIASNIKAVVNNYVKIELEYFILMFLLPLIFMNWIKNLKLLAPFSTAANFITFVSFGILIYILFRDGPTFEGKDPVGKLEHLPLFFGTVLFALEAIGVIMPLENEMKTPHTFGKPFGVLNIGMSAIITLYIGMGLLGYLTYGSKAQGAITLNIEEEDVLGMVVKVTLAVAIFITYALQCYVAIDITWNEYLGPKLEKSSHRTIWEYVTRTVLVIVTFVLAIIVPELDLFISLFGALCLSALGIAIPAMIDLSTYWYSYRGGKFYLILTKNLFLVIFGIFGLVVGTYTALAQIVKAFNEEKH